uniref:MAT homeobox alpha 2 protein n=1 Tax=Suhomyces guaymorum TaxID=234535 RepID=A0A3S9NLZ0_9ASCO|nr:MAT homeobox alpha 2 protein [Suhomyces guaymorum]
MSDLFETLKCAESKLDISLEKVKTNPNIDWERIRLQIEDTFNNVKKNLFDKAILEDGEMQVLQHIVSLLALLKHVCEKRLHQLQANKLSNEDFNIDFKKPKGNRFSDEQTHILEEWHNFNIEHPYLNASSLEDLHKRTGLTRVQVRDWVSYKRRKQKSKFISEELRSFFTQN